MMKCVIIDDEPLAVDVIEAYVKRIGDIEIVSKCNNPVEAASFLSAHQVDLVFLDIEMPNLTGIELVKTLDSTPQFIFTTAYPQYALEGFDLNATDYLVKPIPFKRFLTAVTRAQELYQLQQKVSNITHSIKNNIIFVKSEYENIKLNITDITYIQGLKDYIKIYTTQSDKAILTLLSFGEILDKLPVHDFIRVHRSFVVNINHIDTLQKTKIIIDDVRIPIGETYKKEVLKRLGV